MDTKYAENKFPDKTGMVIFSKHKNPDIANVFSVGKA
jgi:hypothetical protein